jgi:hypothetical protein
MSYFLYDRGVDTSLMAGRLLLAAVFLLAAGTKLVNTAKLKQGLPEFGVPAWLASPLAIFLPVLELVIAGALVPTNAAWYGACGALALLTVFAFAAGIAMWRGRRPDCNCFGQLHSSPVGWSTLVRNAVLGAVALWVIVQGRVNSRPEVWTWFASLNSNERKAAIVAGCAIAFCFFYLVDRERPAIESSENETEAERPEPQSQERPPAPEKPPVLGIGLPISTPAPDFELTTLAGGKRSLQSLLAEGSAVALIFSSPYCGSCAALTSELVRWMREMEILPNIILISRGTTKDNLAKFKGFEPSGVLLQREFEVSEAYDCSSTPSAVLIGADGRIESDLAVGGSAIQQLLSSYAKRDHESRIL